MTTGNHSIEPASQPILETFAAFVSAPEVDGRIRELAETLLPKLSRETPLAFAEISLDTLQTAVPDGVGTIRVAVFHPGCETGIERHANSRQVLYSVGGTGETRVLRNGEWEVDSYGQVTPAMRLEERWHVVEPGVWHHSVATGSEPWILAALHSASQVQDEHQH